MICYIHRSNVRSLSFIILRLFSILVDLLLFGFLCALRFYIVALPVSLALYLNSLISIVSIVPLPGTLNVNRKLFTNWTIFHRKELINIIILSSSSLYLPISLIGPKFLTEMKMFIDFICFCVRCLLSSFLAVTSFVMSTTRAHGTYRSTIFSIECAFVLCVGIDDNQTKLSID